MKSIIFIFLLAPVLVYGQWQTLSSPTTNWIEHIEFFDDEHGIIADNAFPPQIWYTGDGGLNWQTISVGNPNFYPLDITTAENGLLLMVGADTVFTSGQLYLSTDTGRTWSNTGPSSNREFTTGIIVDSTTLIISDIGGKIYRSVNRGQTWDSLSTQLSLSAVFSGVAVDDHIYFGAFYNVPQTFLSYGCVLYSHDGGNSWDTTHVGGWQFPEKVDFVNADTGFVLTTNGIYRTEDGGINWQEENTGVSQPAFADMDFRQIDQGVMTSSNNIYLNIDGVYTLAYNGGSTAIRRIDYPGNVIYAGGANGLLLKSTGTIGRSEKNMPALTIYPNPSGGKIRFSGISAEEYKLFSINGRLLQEGKVDSDKKLITIEPVIGDGIYYLQFSEKGVIKDGIKLHLIR